MNTEHQNGIVTGNGVLAEQALRASELSYRRLFEAAPDGILILDDDTGRISDVNPFLLNLFDFSRDEMVGKTVGELGLFKNNGSNKIMFERLQKGGYIRCDNLPLETGDGRKIAVELIGNMYQAGDKKMIQCRIRDITEHKRLEETLRQSEEHYHGLFEHMVEGYAYCKMIFENGEPRDWTYLAVNPMFEKLTGLKGVAGKRVSEVIPRLAETDPEVFKIYGRVSLTGKAERFEMFVQALQQWFAVSVYSPEKEFFVAVFDVITGRKITEEKLKLTRALMENSADAIHVVDPATGRFLDMNEQACRTLGYTRDEHLALTVFDVTVWVDRALFDETIARARKAGHVTVEARHRRKDGSTFPVEVSLTPVTLDREYLMVIVRDITERKRSEEALRDRETQLRLALDAARMGMWDWDIQTGRVVWSSGHEALWGYAPGTFPGTYEGYESRLHPDDVEGARRAGQKALDEHTNYEHEYRVRRPDGTERWIAARGQATYGPDGRPTRMTGVAMDITERKRVEESQARLATAVEQSAETIVITDTDGKILYANPAFEKISGYTRAEALGQNSRILKSGQHDAEFYRRMWEVLGRGETWSGHITNRRKDGKLYDEEASISPIRDAAGKIVSYMAVKRDVTRELQLEAQFHQAQKMEAVGQLAGGVAHDFNNILGVIIGYGELITEDLEPDSPLRTYAEEIRQAAERAKGLTQQLLLFSRKQNVQLVVLDLNETVKNLEKMLRRLIGENVEMALVPGSEIGRIKADTGYVGQVLMNLTVNARDAMPHGGKLTIATRNATLDENYTRTHQGVLPGDYVMLAVSDTGTGMTPEVKARIFEALFTTKPAGKGTGLGLATCHSIVQQSGGHIEVDTEVGKGTTFKIYFPRVDKPVEAAAAKDQTGPVPRGTETLLIVEDEAPVRHLAWKVLETLGYTVLRASNGQDGLNLARDHKGSPIRLVVTDVIMPRMGGKVMADWLKTIYPDLKVLFTSGYTDDALAQQGVLEPGVAFLPKPYAPAVLARKVRAMLDNENDTAQLRKPGAGINQSAPGPTGNP